MVFTIGNLWDKLGKTGTWFLEHPLIQHEGWGVKEKAKGMTLTKVFQQEAEVIGAFPSKIIVAGAKGALMPFAEAGASIRQHWIDKPTSDEPGIIDRVLAPADQAAAAIEDMRGYAEDVVEKGTDIFSGELIHFPEGFGTVDLSQLGLTEAMTAMGQSLASALSGVTPTIPKVPGLTDEEGKPNYLLMAALAIGGYVIVKKVA